MKETIHIELPGSKSISHRALIINKLIECSKVDGDGPISNLSISNDTKVLQRILKQNWSREEVNIINVEDAGTPCRFLLALLSMHAGFTFNLLGSKRMHQRPIEELVKALQQMGADIEYLDKTGYLPVRIIGRELNGGVLKVEGDKSSQFISAILLIAPHLKQPTQITIPQNQVSKAYISMTQSIMKHFGAHLEEKGQTIKVNPRHYLPRPLTIESDWSSASFIYAHFILSKQAQLKISNLNLPSVQGDSILAKFGKNFGVETQINSEGIVLNKIKSKACIRQMNLSDYPDLAIPLIVLCSILGWETIFNGLDHLVYKESNRLAALQQELLKAGIQLKQEEGNIQSIRINDKIPAKLEFNSFDDHRLVMALHLFTWCGVDTSFDKPDCVEKSFPNYWKEIEKILN